MVDSNQMRPADAEAPQIGGPHAREIEHSINHILGNYHEDFCSDGADKLSTEASKVANVGDKTKRALEISSGAADADRGGDA